MICCVKHLQIGLKSPIGFVVDVHAAVACHAHAVVKYEANEPGQKWMSPIVEFALGDKPTAQVSTPETITNSV